MQPDSRQQVLWEEARAFAVAEILAKHSKELAEKHSEHFRRLMLCSAESESLYPTPQPLPRKEAP
jgi:hypothetical protein